MTSPSRSLQHTLTVWPYTGNSFSVKCFSALSTPLGLYHSPALLPLFNVCVQEAFITLSSEDWEIIIQNSQYTETGLHTIMLLEAKKKGKLFCISFEVASL